MSVRTMYLPRLVAGRDFAAEMVRRAFGEVAGEQITVDCAELLSGSSSFASGLVQAILVDGQAAKLTLANSPDTFAQYVTEAVRDFRVTGKFDLNSAETQLAVG